MKNFILSQAWYFFNLSSSYHSIIYRERDIICPWNSGDAFPYADKATDQNFDNFDHILSIQHAKHVSLNTPTLSGNIFDSINFNHSHQSQNGTSESKYATSLNSDEFKRMTKRQKEMFKVGDKTINTNEPYKSTVRTCSLYIVVDHTFFVAVGSDLMRALADVAYHIEEADTVYRGTDFNGDGVGK